MEQHQNSLATQTLTNWKKTRLSQWVGLSPSVFVFFFPFSLSLSLSPSLSLFLPSLSLELCITVHLLLFLTQILIDTFKQTCFSWKNCKVQTTFFPISSSKMKSLCYRRQINEHRHLLGLYGIIQSEMSYLHHATFDDLYWFCELASGTLGLNINNKCNN